MIRDFVGLGLKGSRLRQLGFAISATSLLNAKGGQPKLGNLGDLHAAARKTQNDTQRENRDFATKRNFAVSL